MAYNREINTASEINLNTSDYNLLFSTLRNARFQSTDDVTNQMYDELIEKFSKLTQTMKWLAYEDDVIIGIKKAQYNHQS
jgi:hypothetical protein